MNGFCFDFAHLTSRQSAVIKELAPYDRRVLTSELDCFSIASWQPEHFRAVVIMPWGSRLLYPALRTIGDRMHETESNQPLPIVISIHRSYAYHLSLDDSPSEDEANRRIHWEADEATLEALRRFRDQQERLFYWIHGDGTWPLELDGFRHLPPRAS